MTTSIHLCLGPCVGLVALLSLLQSSCFWGRLSLMRSRWPSHCNRCFCIVIAIGSSHACSKLSEFLILFHLETPRIDRMHRMWNVFKRCKFGCVTDQVSQPYSKTGLTRRIRACSQPMLKTFVLLMLIFIPHLQQDSCRLSTKFCSSPEVFPIKAKSSAYIAALMTLVP